MEGEIDVLFGLGILSVETTMTEEKITRQSEFQFQLGGLKGKGYEIHMGETTAEKQNLTCIIDGRKNDSYFLNEKTWGSYILGYLITLKL